MHKFYNFPIEAKRDDYSSAIEIYTDLIKKYPEVMGLYQIGNVGVPGISDIDLILILDNNKRCQNNYSIYQIPKEFHKLLLHDVFIIPQHLSKNILELTNIFDLVKVYENNDFKLEFEDISTELEFLLTTFGDQINEDLIDGFRSLLTRFNVDVHFTMARLNSLKYGNLMIKRLGILLDQSIKEDLAINSFIERTSVLRNDFFINSKLHNQNEVISLLETAQNQIIPNYISKYTRLFNYYLNRAKTESSQQVKIPIGEILQNNIYRYSLQKGPISDKLQILVDKKFVQKPSNIESDFLNQYLTKRIELLNRWGAFLDKNNINYGHTWRFSNTLNRFCYRKGMKSKLKERYFKLIHGIS